MRRRLVPGEQDEATRRRPDRLVVGDRDVERALAVEVSTLAQESNRAGVADRVVDLPDAVIDRPKEKGVAVLDGRRQKGLSNTLLEADLARDGVSSAVQAARLDHVGDGVGHEPASHLSARESRPDLA